MPEEEGPITVGEIIRSLRNIEVKLDKITADHEQRLRKLEVWMYAFIGMSSAGFVTGVGALFNVLGT